MTRFIHLFFIVYILTASPAWANNYDFTKLTLNDAHNIALDNNYELIYLKEEIKSRYSAGLEYQAQYFPQINAGVIFPFYGRSSSINVDQLLFDFGKLSKRINAGKYLVRAQEYAHEGKKIQILNQITEKFYEILKAKNLIEGFELELKLKEKLVEKSAAFLEAGRVSSLDLTQKKLHLSSVELQKIQHEGVMRKNQEELFTLLGVSTPDEVGYIADQNYTKIDLNAELIIDSYLMNMYEVKALEMTILSTKSYISAIYRDFLPNIVARASYRFKGKGVSSEDTLDLIGGMGATWQLFNGGRTYHQIQAQKSLLKAQITKLRMLKQRLGGQVKTAIIEAETKYYRISVIEQSLESSLEHYEYVKTKYNSGESSEVNLLEATNLKNKQEIFYQNSIYDYIIKIARIERITGLNITK